MTIKIKHVDKLKNGSLRFRRKFPKDVAEALEKSALQVFFRHRDGLAFQREYDALLREFDSIVGETREELTVRDTRSPTLRWHHALLKSQGLLAEVKGLEDDEQFARELLIDGLTKKKGTDPLVVKALMTPEAEAPQATLQDARLRYEKDRGYGL